MPFRRLAPALAVGMALLAACTSHAASSTTTATPSQTQTSSTHASSAAPAPTPSRTGPLTTGPNVRPGESPPDVGANIHNHSFAAGFGFGADFVRVLDWSIATNDAYLLQLVSSPTCGTCERYISRIEDIRTKAETLRGGRLRLMSFTDVTSQHRTRADHVVSVTTVQQASQVEDRDGQTISTEKGSTEKSLVYVVWSSRGWRIQEVTAP